MSFTQSIILGLIQGLGEFLPISSSGHLLLSRLLLGIQTDTPAMKMLDILLHVGTLIPILIVFWKDWIHMLRHPIRDHSLLLLFIASLPTLGIYLAAKMLFPEIGGFSVFDNGWFLGVSFLITALFLVLCDLLSRARTSAKAPGVFQALVMGFFQGIGMIPGISRSGSTIFGGVLSGMNKQNAAKFSFMMSVPAIVGSMLMEGKDALEQGYLSQIDPLPAAVGILVAAVFGYLAIRLMLRLISRVPLVWFALYLALIGILYLVLQLGGVSFLPAFTVAVPSAVNP